MDKDKFNKEINKIFQNKKFVNCLIVLLAIIFLWLAVSNFLGDDIGIAFLKYMDENDNICS